MSLVGPRPIVEPELSKYGSDADRLLTVKPGLGGIWQVGGRSDTSYPERVAKDMRYIDSRSLWLDLKLLVLTALTVIRGAGRIDRPQGGASGTGIEGEATLAHVSKPQRPLRGSSGARPAYSPSSWRGRWLIAASVPICLARAGASLVPATRYYRATAKLLVLPLWGPPAGRRQHQGQR